MKMSYVMSYFGKQDIKVWYTVVCDVVSLSATPTFRYINRHQKPCKINVLQGFLFLKNSSVLTYLRPLWSLFGRIFTTISS